MFFDSLCSLFVLWVVIIDYGYSQENDQNLVQMCDSQIYCQGPILKSVNLFKIYNDSKDYVDKPLKKSPEQTLNDFYQTFPNFTYITADGLKKFLHNHFRQPGNELLSITPSDWSSNPKSFQLIKDPTYRTWAYKLNEIWLQLCKKVDPQVLKHPDHYSLISVPNAFVIPGGRFREYYYWDAYWIVKGLLVSGMYNTSKDMIKNYVYLVNTIGFVPNGGRKYYLKRSQPPTLIRMAYDYYQETGDQDFVSGILSSLESELNFWSNNRSINVTLPDGARHKLFQYNTPSNVPRPESYSEDVRSASNMSESDRRNFYGNVASTAESGWDFSSRWFEDKLTLQTVKTQRIIPVDLNAYICGNIKLLRELFFVFGQIDKAKMYDKMYEDFVSTMMTVFYNSTSGVWFDLDMDTKKHNAEFYPSSFVPLFTECYKFNDNATLEKTLKYLNDVGAMKYPGGIPTSLRNTTQQWDFPNAFPPLVHMIIEGFRKSGNTALQNAAFSIANDWISNGYVLFNQTSYMYEKYDVTESAAGSGGEYQVQVGFGWTNGVILDLLQTYGNCLVFTNAVAPTINFLSLNVLLLVLIFLFC